MLREIRELGFEYAELSHGIRLSLVPGIIEAVENGEIKICSLHNFCPLPIGITHAAPNVFKFTSDDKRERDKAYRYSLQTIEMAAKLGAEVVVLHLGSVDMRPYTKKLLRLVEHGKKGGAKYERICLKAIEKREKKKEKHFELMKEILRDLEVEAEKRGVKLGIENRETLEEIPFETDFMLLLNDFPDGPIGYWHDMGHAQIKENMGFIEHKMHLESLADRLLGVHIHDVQFPDRDHCPPGTGDIDFDALKGFIKPDHLKVFELSPRLNNAEVMEGVNYIKSVWGEG
ncbi:MAG: sugar phosphate isomerase/epimerase [Verrucomicrobia bacterium]|nr:sugar phosphate isomerase/epimerase [Verrucomicrobiota bacterium]